MRPLPVETDRADGTDRQGTRPDPVETRPPSDEDEIWLEVQEF